MDLYFIYLYMVLRIKQSASHMLGKHSITVLQPQSVKIDFGHPFICLFDIICIPFFGEMSDLLNIFNWIAYFNTIEF